MSSTFRRVEPRSSRIWKQIYCRTFWKASFWICSKEHCYCNIIHKRPFCWKDCDFTESNGYFFHIWCRRTFGFIHGIQLCKRSWNSVPCLQGKFMFTIVVIQFCWKSKSKNSNYLSKTYDVEGCHSQKGKREKTWGCYV